MQKKIIALAIAAAFSAPAFADTSIYGILDVGYGNTEKTVTTPAGVETKYGQSALELSTATSSRLGFVTTEELSDGMKATVKVESGISSNPMAGVAQTGTSAITYNGTTLDATTLGNRELWASVALAQGTTIKLGYGSTPVRDFSLAYDAAGGGNLIGNALVNDAAFSSNRATTIDVSQQFGAVKGTVSVMKNTDTITNKADTEKGNGYLLAAQYVDGPISAGLAYQSQKSVTPAVAYVAPVVGNGTTTASTLGSVAVAATDTTTKTTVLAGSYDLGAAKLFAQYGNVKIDDATAALTKGNGKRTYEDIGVNVPFGAVMVFAQVSKGKVDQVTTAAAASNSRSMSGYTVGARYSMSKLTSAYVSLGETKMDSAVGAADSGIKVNQMALGLIHSF